MMALLLLGYGVCAILAYGFTLGYDQGEWPTIRGPEHDVPPALLVGACGPVGLIVIALLGGFKHGLKFIPEGPDYDA